MAQQLRFERWDNPDDRRSAAISQAAAQGNNALLTNLLRGAQQKQEQEFRASEAEKERQHEKDLIKRRDRLASVGIGKEPKESQFKAAGFAKRAGAASKDLEELMKSGYDPTEFSDVLLGGLSSTGSLGKWLTGQMSPGRTQFEQSARDFVSAVLRKESGAAIGEEEYNREVQKYFPMPGDDPKTIQRKARARQQAIESLTGEAGAASQRIKTVPRRVDDRGNVQDQQALEWARQNPNDPRAQRILQILP